MKTTHPSIRSKIATAWSGFPRSSSWAATGKSAPASWNSCRPTASSTRFVTSISAFLAACAPAPPATPSVADASTSDANIELDTCKPSAGANPVVALGWGQNDYLALADLQTLDVEAGPQGGHHIWIAVRMKNLLGSGSKTVIEGIQPDSKTSISPFEVIFTYEPTEGGYCKLYGLRFQLDADGVDYVPLLGKELDVSATVTDRAGATGHDTRRVLLSTTVR
jgi:hypothetical protein